MRVRELSRDRCGISLSAASTLPINQSLRTWNGFLPNLSSLLCLLDFYYYQLRQAKFDNSTSGTVTRLQFSTVPGSLTIEPEHALRVVFLSLERSFTLTLVCRKMFVGGLNWETTDRMWGGTSIWENNPSD